MYICMYRKLSNCILLESFLETHHGPTPIFGIAVGAIIPFTSCWMILQNKTIIHNLCQRNSTSFHIFTCLSIKEDKSEAQRNSDAPTSVSLTPLKLELPHVSLVVVVNHDDSLVAWHRTVAVTQFPFPSCFQHLDCPLFPIQLQSQNCHQRHPGQTDRSLKGM